GGITVISDLCPGIDYPPVDNKTCLLLACIIITELLGDILILVPDGGQPAELIVIIITGPAFAVDHTAHTHLGDVGVCAYQGIIRMDTDIIYRIAQVCGITGAGIRFFTGVFPLAAAVVPVADHIVPAVGADPVYRIISRLIPLAGMRRITACPGIPFKILHIKFRTVGIDAFGNWVKLIVPPPVALYRPALGLDTAD